MDEIPVWVRVMEEEGIDKRANFNERLFKETIHRLPCHIRSTIDNEGDALSSTGLYRHFWFSTKKREVTFQWRFKGQKFLDPRKDNSSWASALVNPFACERRRPAKRAKIGGDCHESDDTGRANNQLIQFQCSLPLCSCFFFITPADTTAVKMMVSTPCE